MPDQPEPELWRTDPRERLLAAIDHTWAHGVLGATPEELVDGYAHHLADYCLWAVYRKWERGDDVNYSKIAGKVKTEFDLWAAGWKTYY